MRLKLQTPWIVVITIAVVIALKAMSGDGGSTVTIFSDESLDDVSWHATQLPADRWIGVVLDQAGWERLPSEVGVPWSRLPVDDPPDFEKEVAVVSFMGAMPTGGYAIALKEAEYTLLTGAAGDGDGPIGRLTLTLGVSSPAPGDMTTQAFTYPASTTTLPREAWPNGALDGIAGGWVELIVVDQDGRNWGPAHVVASAEE